MANYFDQFDAPTSTVPPANSVNFFDQFDAPQGTDLGARPAFYGGITTAIPFGQKITAGIGAGVASGMQALTPDVQSPQSFSDYYNQIRSNQQATSKAHPFATLAGAGTGLVATLPLFEGLGDFLNANELTAPVANLLQPGQVAQDAGLGAKTFNFLANSAKSGISAAPLGALYGAGNAQDGQELQGGLQGAAIGGTIGAALPTAGAALSLGGKVLGGVKDVVGGLTKSGQQAMIGQDLVANAQDPMQALQNLQNIQQYVPNSPVTTGEAALDTGLASLQRGVRNSGVNPFSDIESQQNAARQDALSSIAGTPADIDAATAARAAAAKNLYDAAYNSGPVNSDRIQELLGTPEIQAAINQGLKIQRIESMAAGVPFNPSDYSVTGFNDAGDPIIGDTPNMRLLDAGKKGLDAMIGNETDPVTGKVSQLGRALTQLKGSYLNELDNLNPAYAQARAQYSEMSNPINQMQTLQDIQQKATLNANPDIQSGYGFLSQPKLSGILQDQSLPQTLTPDQLSTLQNVNSDLTRSRSLYQANIRPSGSDTVANANISNSAGKILANTALGKIPVVGNLLKASMEKGLNQQLVAALRDPEFAASLMQNAIQSKPGFQLPQANITPANLQQLQQAFLARQAAQ